MNDGVGQRRRRRPMVDGKLMKMVSEFILKRKEEAERVAHVPRKQTTRPIHIFVNFLNLFNIYSKNI